MNQGYTVRLKPNTRFVVARVLLSGIAPVSFLLASGYIYDVFGPIITLVFLAVALLPLGLFLYEERYTRTIDSGTIVFSDGQIEYHEAGKMRDQFEHDGVHGFISELGRRIKMILIMPGEAPLLIFTGFASAQEAKMALSVLRGERSEPDQDT